MSPVERARAYVSRLPPAVSGAGGHTQTFKAACVLIGGFALSRDEAKAILADWNKACDPPWTDRDLEHKLDEAEKKCTERGTMLTDTPGEYPHHRPLPRQAPVTVPKEAESSPAIALYDRLEEAIAGTRQPVPFGPFDNLNYWARPLVPGTITVLCGSYGTSKSFFLLEAALHWLAKGVPFSILEMEEDREFWLNRALAMRERNGVLTHEEWQQKNPDETRAAFGRHRETLDELGMRLYMRPKVPSHQSITAWVQERAKAGDRIIAVDPVSAKMPGQRIWADDYELVMRCKEIAEASGASLILLTHPPKTLSRDKASSKVWGDDVAGGKAYMDLTQTVLWFEYLPLDEVYACDTSMWRADAPVNRIMQLRKTRNGPGHGWMIGFHFDDRTFSHAEQGRIGKLGQDVKPIARKKP